MILYKLRAEFFALPILAAVLILFAFAQTAEAKEPPKYKIRVDLTENLVFIDEWDIKLQEYVSTEHVFLCSPGRASTPTPTGTFTAKPRAIDWTYDPAGTGEWIRFRSYASVYVNSATNITQSIVFHSLPSSRPDYHQINQRDLDLMGQPSSQGCVRLLPRQAAWIRANCDGSTVNIYYGAGYNSGFWSLREELRKEVPSKAIYPDMSVTENTKFIYTYFGDTIEKLSDMAEISADKIIELNSDIDFSKGIPAGLAVRIKD